MSTAGPETLAPSRIGILAGGGDYPPLLARLATKAGHEVFVAALVGVAQPADFAGSDLQSFRLGQLGRLLAELRRREITDLVLIGGLPRPSFGGLMPEPSTLKYLPHFAKAFQGGDDHLLRGVISFLEGQGFRVRGPAEIAPVLTAPKGPIGSRVASESQRADLTRGFELLDTLSPFDVGQAAIFADHRVVAIEAAEGTDAMIARVRDIAASGRLKLARGDGVLVKAAKRTQDLRVDMPAIGAQTLHNAAAAGLSGIGVRAGQVLVGDVAELGRLADRLGLFVEGVP